MSDAKDVTHRRNVAILDGQIERFFELFQTSGDDRPETNSLGETELHLACWAGRAQIASTLLRESAADPTSTGTLGLTPLHYAIRSSRSHASAMVMELIQHGADVSQRDQYGLTPWLWALITSATNGLYLRDQLLPQSDDYVGTSVSINDFKEALAELVNIGERPIASVSLAELQVFFEERLFQAFLRDQLLLELSHMSLTEVRDDSEQASGLLAEILTANRDNSSAANFGSWCERAADVLGIDSDTSG